MVDFHMTRSHKFQVCVSLQHSKLTPFVPHSVSAISVAHLDTSLTHDSILPWASPKTICQELPKKLSSSHQWRLCLLVYTPRPLPLSVNHGNVGSYPVKKHAGRLQASYRGLEALYDDGYQTVKNLDYYYESLGELVEHDSGPVRWFCPVDAGSPIEDAPLMLYLPGKLNMPSINVVLSMV